MGQGKSLVVNVDVSNTTFWHTTAMSQLALLITDCSDMIDLAEKCKPIENNPPREPGTHESPQFQALKRLQKNEFFVQFRNCPPGKLPSMQFNARRS